MAAVSGMMDRFKYFREITTVTEKKWMTAIDIVKQQAIFQYIHAENQRGFVVDNCDIFLPQILLF